MRAALLLILTSIALAQSAGEVETTTEPHHHLVFSNDQVRVFNVEVAPHDQTLLHRHLHDYIFVTIGASEITNRVVGKDPVTVKLTDGDTHFLPAPFEHAVANPSDKPFRNVTIELLQDEQLRRTPPHSDPDRGLEILPGGTAEILFVKDGVRVSEFELQPGGVVPSHHHAGPHLVIALTDYELRSDVAGKPPLTLSYKAGESKWIPGGFTHTLTNIGHHPAKFVTLEFPQ